MQATEITLDGYRYTLGDDGSLDTIVRMECKRGHSTEIRLSAEIGAEYRDETGLMVRFSDLVEDERLTDEECTECADLTLWDVDEETVESLGIDVPPWVESWITPSTVAAILQGGCASGAYMPAVTYYSARETMNVHGDAVVEFLEESGISDLLDTDEMFRGTWSQLCCYLLSAAVEAWAQSVEDEILEEIRNPSA